MAKRKRSSVAGTNTDMPIPAVLPTDVLTVASKIMPPIPSRRVSNRKGAQPPPAEIDTNPDTNSKIQDGQEALRASPDAAQSGEDFEGNKVRSKKKKKVAATAASKASTKKGQPSESSQSHLSYVENSAANAASVHGTVTGEKNVLQKEAIAEKADPEAEDEEEADPEEVREALSRPPPVNSSYLPLPWKGRLGYACLNTYLRFATPPVFSSRTCRIASILEHRHPLKDPSQPEHVTKNRPDKDQPANVLRGQAYVEALGLANARDIVKMLRWNDKYGIRFLRLSSEMFPFASHEVYGYKLAPFASEVLAEAGRVAAELGHRLTTHPGQFTQLGSPRPEVIKASIRDLDYHCELLDLLKLPPQEDRNAVMILHMGGTFGDKAATLERFRVNYAKLTPKVKDRLVLENDDVCYSVHDLLPICEELNIPMVLDYHHHNILFDAEQIREGTLDIMSLYDRIKATWDRKSIKQKMHYSEPTPAAITSRQRRKHSPRVATLPPCAPDMDLMIEAKDKEQAVFELMRTFKFPGFDSFNDVLPHTRNDENRSWKPPKKKSPKKRKAADPEEMTIEETTLQPPDLIPDEEIAMGGPEGRVYWPPGMEEWLRPKKREVKPRDAAKAKSTAEKAAEKRAEKAAWQAAREASASLEGDGIIVEASERSLLTGVKVPPKLKAVMKEKKSQSAKTVPTPSTSDHEDNEDEDSYGEMSDLTDRDDEIMQANKKAIIQTPSMRRRQSGREAKKATKSYVEVDHEDDDV